MPATSLSAPGRPQVSKLCLKTFEQKSLFLIYTTEGTKGKEQYAFKIETYLQFRNAETPEANAFFRV